MHIKQNGNLMRKKKGFTLIELLVVIAIIGLIAIFTLTVIARYRDKAKDSRIETALVQVRSIAAGIYTDNSSYEALCSDDGTLNDATYSTLRVIEGEARKFSGSDPVCDASASTYCVQSALATSGYYYCVDSTGVALRLSSSSCPPQCTTP